MKIRSTVPSRNREYGVCHAALQYGNMVNFWCESLTGDSTDVSIVSVTFPNEMLAADIANAASWRGGSLPARRSFGYAIAFDKIVIEFRDEPTAEAVLWAAFTRA